MSGTSTVYFVRHGECRANFEDKNLPPEVDVITDKGIQQAVLLGKHLENVVFTRAYSSTYPRALDTAREVLAQLKGPKPDLQLDERIREREMGEFENRPVNDIFNALFSAVKEKGTQMLDWEVPGGELVSNLENRLSSFLEGLLREIRESKEPQTILVVTHGVLIMRMMLKLRIWSKEPAKALTLKSFSVQKVACPIKNTGYHLLSVTTENDKIQTVIDVIKLHESGHLESLKPKVPAKPNKDIEEITKTWLGIVNEQCATM